MTGIIFNTDAIVNTQCFEPSVHSLHLPQGIVATINMISAATEMCHKRLEPADSLLCCFSTGSTLLVILQQF